MRLYIAGGSDERLTVVRPLVDRMIARGVTITHDWTRCEGYDVAPTEDQSRAYARADMAGVESADIVWIIVPAAKSEGAGSELGAAIALHKPILSSGPHAKRNIFSLLSARIFESHEFAYVALAHAHAERVFR